MNEKRYEKMIMNKFVSGTLIKISGFTGADELVDPCVKWASVPWGPMHIYMIISKIPSTYDDYAVLASSGVIQRIVGITDAEWLEILL